MAQGKRTPTAIKKLQGTFEQCKSIENEMSPPKLEEAEAPGKLVNTFANEEWLRQTKVLSNLGMLTETDLSLLLAYCNECGTYYEAMNNIKENGYYQDSKANGKIISSAYTIANRALANMIKLADKFGFNPAARTKIEMPKQGSDDPFDNL